MRNSLKQFSGFVAELHARTYSSDAPALASWGARHLADTVGFDCAWYGWAQLKSDGVQIHAQCSQNLPDDFYPDWCEMSEQDLLAARIRDNPSQTAVYDRNGRTHTDGMISLADNYGLIKMATAMHLRPDRNASFYLSSYRGGQHSRSWSGQELDYLQCAVNHLSSAMTLSAAEMARQSRGLGHSMLVNDDGIVILGLRDALKKWGALWPEWNDDRLPEHLCSLINISGEHVLVDRQLIVSCEPSIAENSMRLHKLSIRHLTKFDLLTQREQEVAGLLADGNTHKQAARVLGVAPATVRNQTQSIYIKMGVKTRAELALKVMQSGGREHTA